MISSIPVFVNTHLIFFFSHAISLMDLYFKLTFLNASILASHSFVIHVSAQQSNVEITHRFNLYLTVSMQETVQIIKGVYTKS